MSINDYNRMRFYVDAVGVAVFIGLLVFFAFSIIAHADDSSVNSASGHEYGRDGD
jgi:hypothetical protein